jgi:hypothetical protein
MGANSRGICGCCGPYCYHSTQPTFCNAVPATPDNPFAGRIPNRFTVTWSTELCTMCIPKNFSPARSLLYVSGPSSGTACLGQSSFTASTQTYRNPASGVVSATPGFVWREYSTMDCTGAVLTTYTGISMQLTVQATVVQLTVTVPLMGNVFFGYRDAFNDPVANPRNCHAPYVFANFNTSCGPLDLSAFPTKFGINGTATATPCCADEMLGEGELGEGWEEDI